MNTKEIEYWLALKFVDELGNVGFKNLVDYFGSPREVFNAPEHRLKKVHRISDRIVGRIKEFDDWQRVSRELELAKEFDVSIITASDPLYPNALLNIYDFPPLLYVKGQLREDDVNVAVIGSRRASTHGKFITERLSRELAMQGVTIVSGMARGIDSAAHRGALTGAGRTIAVMGCGINVVYPPENKKLFDKIVSHGAVITEFPFHTLPKGQHFPARNRIISGISLGVVVVEATEKSGSLITARLGLEQGKEVFAVPGSIDSPGSKGTHKLLKEGAKLVENVDDIIEEIAPQMEIKHRMGWMQQEPGENYQKHHNEVLTSQQTVTILQNEEREILKLIEKTPIYIDNVIQRSGYHSHEVLSILLSLELKGYIDQLPGKRFVIKE